MHLESDLRRAGGVTTTARLLRAGHTYASLARAVAAGIAHRPRRGWIALRDADPLLVLAARHNALLTCVTAAQSHGLWTLQRPEPHLATRSRHARRPRCTAVVHWDAPLVPRHPELLVDPLENVINCVARCQADESALVIVESALQRQLVTREGLLRLPLGAAARRLVEIATPFSDSGLESLVVSRLRWLPTTVVPQVWIEGHRVDLLIGERLILQIDGAHHTGLQRDEDIRHDAHLATLGYTVIRVSYRQIMEEWHGVHSRILRAIAQGLHRA